MFHLHCGFGKRRFDWALALLPAPSNAEFTTRRYSAVPLTQIYTYRQTSLEVYPKGWASPLKICRGGSKGGDFMLFLQAENGVKTLFYKSNTNAGRRRREPVGRSAKYRLSRG